MIIKHKSQRVGVFIDTQNLYHSARNLYNTKVHFGKIVEAAVAGRALIRAVAYVITTESGEERGFFDALTKMGIETKAKDLQIFGSGAMKADWDVGLAVDAIKLAPKLDAVILLSGDGDFAPLVEYLKTNEGCQVEVVSFSKSTSAKLIEAADDFLDLDKSPGDYLIGSFARREREERSESPKQAEVAAPSELPHRPEGYSNDPSHGNRTDKPSRTRIVKRRMR